MLGAVRSFLKCRTMSWGVKKTLYVFKMKCLRPIEGVTRWDRIRNEEIRRRAGIEETLAEKVDR